MIRLIDDQIGETLDVLRERGMLDDTLIVFTSDHGDMLGDHFMIQKRCAVEAVGWYSAGGASAGCSACW